MARTKVAADIYSMYGTPNDAYDLLSARSVPAAKQYWYLHEHGLNRDAAEVLKDNTGSIMYPFDDGDYHRKMRRAGRRRGQRFKFFVENPEALESYVKTIQGRVMVASLWLARTSGSSRCEAARRREASP
jgi:hypothetical protein